MENNVIDIDIEKLMHTTNGPMTLAIRTSIRLGELIALFGQSGAGKTTLLRILSGLVTPDKGQIRFREEVWFDSEKRINVPSQQRNISLMFQDYALFPNMNVEQNIQFAQTEKKQQKVLELIEQRFSLCDFVDGKYYFLVKGEKNV